MSTPKASDGAFVVVSDVDEGDRLRDNCCPVTAIMSSGTWEPTCSWQAETQVCASHHVVSETGVLMSTGNGGGALPDSSSAGAGSIHPAVAAADDRASWKVTTRTRSSCSS